VGAATEGNEDTSSGPTDGIGPEFLAQVVRVSTDPYVVLSADGTVQFASDTCGEMLGIPVDELMGVNMVDVLHPDSRDQAVRAFTEFVVPDKPPTGWIGPALTVKLLHADGHTVSCRAYAVPSGAPDFDGLVLRVRRTEANDKLDAAIASLVQADDLTLTLSLLLAFATEQMPYSVGAVGLGFDGTRFARVVSDPRAPVFLDADDMLPVVAGAPWAAVIDGANEVHVDSADLPEPLANAAISGGFPGCWAFALDHHGQRRDVLVFWRLAPGPPGPHLTEAIARIMRLTELALEGDRTRRLLEHQASTDELTGLANRTLFTTELEGLRDHPPDRPFGVLYCDLDDFKPINDRFGHTMGDKVLQIAARRIAGQVRVGDIAARIGGDEFAVLCPGTSADALGQLAERLVQAFAEPITVQDHELDLGISVGAALLDPDGTPIDPIKVLDGADAALLAAKAGGKRRWHSADSG
jgi:diguanylate cyclase (GGDEF)-like protein